VRRVVGRGLHAVGQHAADAGETRLQKKTTVVMESKKKENVKFLSATKIVDRKSVDFQIF
jgi:hypothetical protein